MGKAEELTEFIRTRADRLLAYGYVLTGDRVRAEDLVQDALVRTYEHWDALRDGVQPDAYVRRTMYNLHISTWRKIVRRERDLTDIPLRFTSVSDTTDAIDARSGMVARLAQLPVRERAAVVLFYYEDMPVAQIATALDCTESTVRSLLSRARNHLRAALESTEGASR